MSDDADTVRMPQFSRHDTVDLGPTSQTVWDRDMNHPVMPLGVPLRSMDGERWNPVRRMTNGLYVVRVEGEDGEVIRVFRAHPSELWYLPPF